MSQFEPYEVVAFGPISNDLSKPPLPYHVEPADEEALISWLSRLATRLGVSTQTLLQSAGVTTDRKRESIWWLRPEATVLDRIGRRTATDSQKLLSMTFAQWQPARRNYGDTLEQFDPPRQLLTVRSQRRSVQRIVLCVQCLRDDTEPYLRLHWMLGWTALCPRHATVLTSRCPECKVGLRWVELVAHVGAPRCRRCRFDLDNTRARPAHERTIQLQAALLAGKRYGSSEMGSLGMMSWPLVIATIEILLGLARTPTLCRSTLYRYIRRDFDLGEGFDEWNDRYGGLLLVAWLLDRWPRNLRACLGILREPRPAILIGRQNDLHPDVRTGLREIFQPVTHSRRRKRRQHNRTPPWRSWLDHLPIGSEELRARAHRERLKHRRVRLIALAGLRDGRPIEAVAAAIGVKPSTVRRWLDQAAMNGLEALLEQGHGGRLLSSSQLAEIAEWLASSPPPGAPGFRPIRSADVIAESVARFGVQLTRKIANRLLRTHGKSRRWRRPGLHPIRALNSRIMEPVHDHRSQFTN